MNNTMPTLYGATDDDKVDFGHLRENWIVGRVLVRVYSTGKMALSIVKVMLYINILPICTD